jgi:hypothetical protein
MRKRYLRVQAQLFDQSRSIIERLILRKVRKMRALKAGLTGAAYAMAVGSIFDKEPLSEEEAAVRLQKRFRAIDARARSMTLQHAREATRCIRVEVVKARGLRVADARRLNQADHHTFIGGAADPRCYVSAQLGSRGGFGPSNAGAPEEAKERIERQYDILLKRHQALDEQHVRDDGVEKRKYLDALDKLKESREEKKREALASRAANLSSVMDKACLLKMRRNTMPFWMPSIVRARDWGKFAAYPSRYPLFRAKTKVIQKTLDPTWNAQFDVHGVDPDSTVTFTVADVDDPTSPQSADDRDDFLGQVTVQLNALRHADFLAQMTYEAERRAKLKAKAGRRPSKTKQRLQSDGALLVMDARARLGPNLVPVSKVVNEKVNHVAFDDVHVEATGAVYYRIWAAPRARSICGHLEVKVQRGFVVSFWKPVRLAASHLLDGVEGPASPRRRAVARSDRTSAPPLAIDAAHTGFPHTGLGLPRVWKIDAAGPSRRRTSKVGFALATPRGRGGPLAGDGGKHRGYVFLGAGWWEAPRFTSGRPGHAFEGCGAPGLGAAVAAMRA